MLATVSDIAGTLTDDVAGTLAPVEAVVQPVLATVNDIAGTLTDDVAGTLAPVEAVVQPVLATVSDIAGTLTDDVGSTSKSPVPDTSTGQAAGPADTLLALATSPDAPIEALGSATAAPANVVTGTSDAAAPVHPTALAGDVIALKDAPTPPAHALFTGNQYTDYGVTLSSDIAFPPQHALSPAETVSAHDTLVSVVTEVQKHVPPPSDIVHTTLPIDHLGHAIL
jgi:hypothetical protein